MLREEHYKLIRFTAGSDEFYDLQSDPLEKTNLLSGTLSWEQQQQHDRLLFRLGGLQHEQRPAHPLDVLWQWTIFTERDPGRRRQLCALALPGPDHRVLVACHQRPQWRHQLDSHARRSLPSLFARFLQRRPIALMESAQAGTIRINPFRRHGVPASAGYHIPQPARNSIGSDQPVSHAAPAKAGTPCIQKNGLPFERIIFWTAQSQRYDASHSNASPLMLIRGCSRLRLSFQSPRPCRLIISPSISAPESGRRVILGTIEDDRLR